MMKPGTRGYVKQDPPELVERVRELAEKRLPMRQIAAELNAGPKLVRGVMRRNGIKTNAPRGPKKGTGGRPSLKPWRVPATSGDLEFAVQKLRSRYPVVCAEHTIRRPHDRPLPYTEETLFRVGNRKNVPAKTVLRMAR
jgi:hypothetical protein